MVFTLALNIHFWAGFKMHNKARKSLAILAGTLRRRLASRPLVRRWAAGKNLCDNIAAIDFSIANHRQAGSQAVSSPSI